MVMTVLLTGWSGPALATTPGWSTVGGIDVEPTYHPSPEISYTLTRDRGSVRLAAAGAFSMQKTVVPDGSTNVTIECGGDVVSIASTPVAVDVTRGDRSVTVNVNGGHDAQTLGYSRVADQVADWHASRIMNREFWQVMKKRVLLAEDDPDTRVLLSLILAEQGYDVAAARDGVEALALAEQDAPDLIVMDQMMPRMTGSDCLRVMRAHPRLGRVPAVMVTAAAGLVRGAEHLPFDAVVEKPVELDGFVRTVRTLCPPGAERRIAKAPHEVNRRDAV